MRALALSFLLLALPLPAWAWGSDLSLPAAAPVVDEFGLLQRGEVESLTGMIHDIKRNSGVELTVYIPATLQGREIEDFGIAVAEKWQLGRKKEDKGLLLIVAPKERKMRFEVGYGLEGELTDLYTRRVLDDVMRPYFREGQYYEGIISSLAAIQQKVPLGMQEPDVAPASQGKWKRKRGGGTDAFFFAVIVLFVIFSLIARMLGFGRRRRGLLGGLAGIGSGGGWSGGGGSSWGGSSWGGGGGGFGGGGSSSSW